MRVIPISILSLLLFSSQTLSAKAGPWLPIDPQDLALKEGRVQADADAEAIRWEIEVSDEWSGDVIKSSETHYRRIKIFNSRGRDAFNRIDIPYEKGTRLADVAARTIRPDGSVIAVKKDAIIDRTALKGNNLKVKVKSIAMPAVEPGSIVEYRWTAVRYGQLTHNTRIVLQLNIPVEELRLSIHPLPVPLPGFEMRIRAFNFHMPPFTEESPGFRTMTLSSMPATKSEPFAPPELTLRPWISIFYATQHEPPVGAFWRQFGREVYRNSSSPLRPSGEVKRATQVALAGVTDPKLVLERLVEYCRTQIKNSDLSDSGLTKADREWLESEHSATDHLKRGLADSDGVLRVFLSMATAAGLDARLALLPDRSQCSFKSSEATFYLLTRSCAAVNVQGEWRAIDPATDLPPDQLPWQIQGVEMLVPDAETPIFLRTPMGAPEQSIRRRTARLKLSEDGTVEGEVLDVLTGQDAADWRRRLRNRSVLEREKEISDQVKSRMSTAQLSEIHFDPGNAPSDPYRIGYHIRVPGYAQRTTQRMFLQPAFFQRGLLPLFPSAERRLPILFDYAWGETDTVTISLPGHFHLEGPPESAPILLPGVGKHMVSIRLSEDGHALHFLHSMLFGVDGTVYFPVEQYPNLKKAFDQFHAQDETVVSIVSDDAVPR
jgi:hypothetical protein